MANCGNTCGYGCGGGRYGAHGGYGGYGGYGGASGGSLVGVGPAKEVDICPGNVYFIGPPPRMCDHGLAYVCCHSVCASECCMPCGYGSGYGSGYGNGGGGLKINFRDESYNVHLPAPVLCSNTHCADTQVSCDSSCGPC